MLRLLVAFFSLSFVQVNAAQRVSLYEVTIPVSDQSADQRDEAFKTGLVQILYRTTNVSDIQFDDRFDGLIEQAPSFVQSFRFSDNTRYVPVLPKELPEEAELNDASIPSGIASASEVNPFQNFDERETDNFPYFVEITYSAEVLEPYLRQLNVPLWGALRPDILTWVVVQKGGDRSLLSLDVYEQADVFLERADFMALPLFLPAGDLEDISGVDLTELWGLFPSSVTGVSERYPHDGVLLVRVYEAEEGLELKWSLQSGASTEVASGRLKEISYFKVWQSLNNEISNTLFDQYAVAYDQDADKGSYRVAIEGIQTFADYAGVSKHLAGLSSVKSADLSLVQNDVLFFNLSLHGALQSFEQQVYLSGRLTQINVAELNSFPVASDDLVDDSSINDHLNDIDSVVMRYQWASDNRQGL